jgi:predicted enzyme related to lactoylglutathione lyase
MGRVVHFEIHADDPERAGRFYERAFGWTIQKWEAPQEGLDYWLVTTGPESEAGINGGIMKRRDPQGAVYNTIAVDSVEAACRRLEECGGKVVVPKFAVPGVGWVAYFRDTEGNVFGVHQADPSAA